MQRWMIGWVGLVCVWLCAPTTAQDASQVMARVDGQPITLRRVQQEVEKVLNGRTPGQAERASLQAQAVEQLIGRALVFKALGELNLAASESELRLARERALNKMKTQELTLAQFLQRSGLTEAEFQEALAWEIGWKRYLQRYLTDQNLERYFNQHPLDFNGAQMEVAHLLLKVDPEADEQAWQAAEAEAVKIRTAINAAEMTFAIAARQHSSAPTADKGGAIGAIRRHEPMPESFSRAAFALQQGEVSPPVRTVFGVHLIHCQRIVPGTRTWQDARPELEAAVTRYLFDFLVNRQRPKAKIEYP